MHETYLSVLLSPAHLLAELTVEVATTLVIYPIIRYLVKLHDRKVHGHNE